MIAIELFLILYGLWIVYLAIMNLMRARDNGTLSKPAYCLGLPLLYVALACDFFLNAIVGSVLFVELPREWTFSARLEKHAHEFTWRGALARWIAANLLDAFDPSGRHIR